MNGRWISSKDEMPEENVYVLGFCPKNDSTSYSQYMIVWRSNNEWHDGYSSAVSDLSHWMKLPKLPDSE